LPVTFYPSAVILQGGDSSMGIEIGYPRTRYFGGYSISWHRLSILEGERCNQPATVPRCVYHVFKTHLEVSTALTHKN